MSFTTVIVSQRAKLDLKTGYVVIRTESETKKIFIDELSVLIIENPMVSLTGCLVSEYLKKDIFMIVGLRSYLTDKQAYGLFKSALLSGITLICVDDRISTLLDCEKRTIIDDDMCMI